MIDLDQQLSPHFTLRELVRSEAAERVPARKRAQENLPPEVVANLEFLCRQTIEPARLALGLPLVVTSGYRCPAVNRAVGGARASQHLLGQAADLHLGQQSYNSDGIWMALGAVPELGNPPSVAADFILFAWYCLHLEEAQVDQVIHEYGEPGRPAWVHVSHSEQHRRQILLIDLHKGRRRTRELSVEQALSLGRVP